MIHMISVLAWIAFFVLLVFGVFAFLLDAEKQTELDIVGTRPTTLGFFAAAAAVAIACILTVGLTEDKRMAIRSQEKQVEMIYQMSATQVRLLEEQTQLLEQYQQSAPYCELDQEKNFCISSVNKEPTGLVRVVRMLGWGR